MSSDCQFDGPTRRVLELGGSKIAVDQIAYPKTVIDIIRCLAGTE